MCKVEIDTPSVEIENGTKYDVIIPLPTYPFPQEKLSLSQFPFHGIVERLAGLPYTQHMSGLWIDTRLKDLAAALMVSKGESLRIMTLSRSIRPWMNQPYAKLMANDIRYWLTNIGTDQKPVEIIQEPVDQNSGSYDLLTEIEVVLKFASLNDWKNIALISDQVHRQRVTQIIDRYRDKQVILPDITVLPMEEILSDIDYIPERHQSRLSRIIDNLHKSVFWKFWITREFIARNSMGIITWLAKKTR